MLNCLMHKNKVLYSLKYSQEVLTLGFIKAGNVIQYRKYRSVPTQIVYKLFYHKSGAEAISIFNQHIKNQYQVIEITLKP